MPASRDFLSISSRVPSERAPPTPSHLTPSWRGAGSSWWGMTAQNIGGSHFGRLFDSSPVSVSDISGRPDRPSGCLTRRTNHEMFQMKETFCLSALMIETYRWNRSPAVGRPHVETLTLWYIFLCLSRLLDNYFCLLYVYFNISLSTSENKFRGK